MLENTDNELLDDNQSNERVSPPNIGKTDSAKLSKSAPNEELNAPAPENSDQKGGSTSEVVAEQTAKIIEYKEEVPLTEKENTSAQQDQSTSSIDGHEPHLKEVSIDAENKGTKTDHEQKETTYKDLSLKEIVDKLDHILKNEKVQYLKKIVDQLTQQFNTQCGDYIDEKKKKFLDNGGNESDFNHHIPEKKEFFDLIKKYRAERQKYYKDFEETLNKNLKIRLSIIEELRSLIDTDQQLSNTYTHFKNLQKKWKETGPVPRSETNNLWKTYHFQVGRFYDYLHLNREFRELDHKFNLEEKLKIIEHAEKLANSSDVVKAFRDLQVLHKRWKDELGPVSKEQSDEIWDRFSQATKIIHDKRQFFLNNQDALNLENLEKKRLIIAQMQEIVEKLVQHVGDIQRQSKTIDGLKEAFFELGRVPKGESSKLWGDFKTLLSAFSKKRNTFYKKLKKEHNLNLSKRIELIEQAETLKESTDWKSTTQKFITLQKKWKTIGATSRKHNETTWKRFRDACNVFFERLDNSKNKESAVQIHHFEEKRKILAAIEVFEPDDNIDDNISYIKEWVKQWKQIGFVPTSKRRIEEQFKKAVLKAFTSIGLDKKSIEETMYAMQLESMEGNKDEIYKELQKIQRKIDEANQNILQLETNLQFFGEHQLKNPIVQKVQNDIAKFQENVNELLNKKKHLRQLLR